jgi:hypothetical protein
VSALDAPRPLRRPGDTDAVTFSFADAAAELYGLVRVATGIQADGARGESALAVALAGRRTIGAVADAGAVSATVDEPLGRWRVRCGEPALELEFEAMTPPAELSGRQAAAKAGGLEGYEQLCRVQGTVAIGGREHAVHCFGQRSHLRGAPDWERLAATRTVAAWLDDGTAISLTAVRPRGARGHDEDAMWAALLDPAGSLHVAEPRLSTTYDADGRQRRAGMELWVGEEDEHPRRAAGEVVAGSTLELGALRLDAAVFNWHAHGRRGVGRYDILRPAA